MPRKRSPKSSLQFLLDQAPFPVCLLDSQNQLVYANESLATWLGVPAAKILGLDCGPLGLAAETPELSAVRGLGIPFDRKGDLQTTYEVFVSSPHRPIERRMATAFQIEIASSRKNHWLVLIQNSSTPLALDRRGSLQSQIAQIVRDQLPDELPAATIGHSLTAMTLRQQLENAIRSRSHTTLFGPPGMERELMAKYIYRQISAKESAAPSNPTSTLSLVNCTIADQMMIQDTFRRIPRLGNDSQARQWILLIDLDRLSTAAAMELDGFLELPQSRVRLLSTTSAEPHKLADFPRGLLARVSSQVIPLARLSERKEDLALIFQFVLEQRGLKLKSRIPQVPDATREMLLEYSWPKNMEELGQAVDDYFKREQTQGKDDSCFRPEDFPERIRIAIEHGRLGRPTVEPIDLMQRLETIEREFIARALEQTKSNRSQAAKLLGISRTKLLRRCEQLGISIIDKEPPIEFEWDAVEEIEFGTEE